MRSVLTIAARIHSDSVTLILLALSIGCSSGNGVRATSAFHEVGTFRSPNMHAVYPAVAHFVVAPESVMRDRQTVLAYGRGACADEEVCVVLFWTDESVAAVGLPLSDREARAMVASYNRNRSTGADGFQCYSLGAPKEHCTGR